MIEMIVAVHVLAVALRRLGEAMVPAHGWHAKVRALSIYRVQHLLLPSAGWQLFGRLADARYRRSASHHTGHHHYECVQQERLPAVADPGWHGVVMRDSVADHAEMASEHRNGSVADLLTVASGGGG